MGTSPALCLCGKGQKFRVMRMFGILRNSSLFVDIADVTSERVSRMRCGGNFRDYGRCALRKKTRWRKIFGIELLPLSWAKQLTLPFTTSRESAGVFSPLTQP